MTEESIALAVGITIPTLRKHFMPELTTGAAVKKMEAMDALYAAAKKGNVSAIKTVLLLQSGSEPPPQPGSDPAAAAPPPSQRLGKKEAAQIAASSAADGTDWAGILPGSAQVQ